MSFQWIKTEPEFSNPVTQDENGITYTQRFRVHYNVDTGNNYNKFVMQLIEVDAHTAQGVPRYGDQFKGNKAAFCRNISTQIDSSQSKNTPTQVIVTCTFTTLSADKRDEEENPLEKKPDVVWGTYFERQTIENARILKINGIVVNQVAGQGNKLEQINNFEVPIINSAGQKFNPAPEVDVPYITCTIVQNLAEFDPGQANNMIQTVNVRSFKLDGYTIEPGQALLLRREAGIEYQGKLSYRVVTTEILIKENHELHLLDNGKMAFRKDKKSNNFNGGKPEDLVVIDIDNINTPDNQRLDGNGNPLDDPGAKGVFLEYGIFAVSDFRILNLPEQRL